MVRGRACQSLKSTRSHTEAKPAANTRNIQNGLRAARAVKQDTKSAKNYARP